MTSTNKLCKFSEALRRKTNLGKEVQPWYPFKSTVYNNVFNLQILLCASAVLDIVLSAKDMVLNKTNFCVHKEVIWFGGDSKLHSVLQGDNALEKWE